MLIRNTLEEKEKKILSPFAALSSKPKRRKLEKECDIRTAFQRDRDKIIHCKAFRRLKHKTQVFISPIEDHYRTRLTHTLEVAQISRTISRALFLNEDLTEAIALGHDLGHTPFGHSGEDVLDYILKHFYKSRFLHNEQSLRVVDHLERNGKGLNLTEEIRDGILHHPQKDKTSPKTLEGQAVRASDHIAYINHDVEDSIRAGIIKKSDIPKHFFKVLGENMLDTTVKDVIYQSQGKEKIVMSPKIEKALNGLYDFLNERVYTNPVAKSEENKTDNLINTLFRYYMDHPEELSGYSLDLNEAEIVRKITDFIAGMTDRYAINKYSELFIPSEWRARFR